MEKIEKGEYRGLPPDVYSRGFVKRYASFLGLDSERISFLYRREWSIQERINRQKQAGLKAKEKIAGGGENKFKKQDIFKNDFSGSFSKQKLLIVTPKILTFLLGIIVLAAAIFYLWHQINSFNTVPQLRLAEPSEDRIINQSDIYFRGQTEKDVELKINGEVVYLDLWGNFEAEVNLQEGLNVIVLEAENHFGKKAKVVRRVIYEKSEN